MGQARIAQFSVLRGELSTRLTVTVKQRHIQAVQAAKKKAEKKLLSTTFEKLLGNNCRHKPKQNQSLRRGHQH